MPDGLCGNGGQEFEYQTVKLLKCRIECDEFAPCSDGERSEICVHP